MFVSRAENKLKDATEAFGFVFRDKVVLDIGSSTGGFSEYALSKGAKKVYAIEKGTKQMKEPLRFDPRIVLYEKTDIFDVTTSVNIVEKNEANNRDNTVEGKTVKIEVPDVILADVSFVSLRKILKHVKEHISGDETSYLIMLKPQFEARKEQLNRGVVKNERMRREIIRSFETWLKQNGFFIYKKKDNDFLGRNGNQEKFYWLKNSKQKPSIS